MSLAVKTAQLLVAPLSEITADNLKEKLSLIKGSTFVGFISHTIPKMRKTGNPYWGKVIKRSSISGNVGFDYEASINRRKNKEGQPADFISSSNWHEPVLSPNGSLTPLSKHKSKDQYYLRVSVNSAECQYINIETGEVMDSAHLEPFLQKTDYGASQGLSDENALKFTCYALENIKMITINKETFKVIS